MMSVMVPLQVLLLRHPSRYVNVRYESEKRSKLLSDDEKPVALRIVDTLHSDVKVCVEAAVVTLEGDIHGTYYLSCESWTHSTSENLYLNGLQIFRKAMGKNGMRGPFRIRFTARYENEADCIASCETDDMFDGSCGLREMNPCWGYADGGQEIWIQCERGVPIAKNKVTAMVSFGEKDTMTADCRVDCGIVKFNLPKLHLEQPLRETIQATVQLKICKGNDVIMLTKAIGFQYIPDGPPNSIKPVTQMKIISPERVGKKTFESSVSPDRACDHADSIKPAAGQKRNVSLQQTSEYSMPPEVKKGRYLPPESEQMTVSEILTNATPGLPKTFSEPGDTPEEKVRFRECTDDDSQFVSDDAENVENRAQASISMSVNDSSYTDTTEQCEDITQTVVSCHGVIPSTELSTGSTANLATFNCSASTIQPQSQLDSMPMATTSEPPSLLPSPNYQNQEMESSCNLFGVIMPTYPDERAIATLRGLLPQNAQLPPPDTGQQSPHLQSTSNFKDPPDSEYNVDELLDIINETYDRFGFRQITDGSRLRSYLFWLNFLHSAESCAFDD